MTQADDAKPGENRLQQLCSWRLELFLKNLISMHRKKTRGVSLYAGYRVFQLSVLSHEDEPR